MTSSYKGMRWHKCDLHIHTPADTLHWQGDRLIKGNEAEVAKEFAEACFLKGLQAIGVTDHNFINKNFIPHLQKAFAEVEDEWGHKTTIFPGFEFEAAGVGRGTHVLGLFAPDTHLDQIDSILTKCGIRYPRKNAVGSF